jgi:hypothetical protein
MTKEDWRVVRTQAVGSVEEEWESFRGTIQRRLEEVCGLRTVGAVGRKNEWWCTEMAVAVSEKRETFALWLQKKTKRVGRSITGREEMQEQ